MSTKWNQGMDGAQGSMYACTCLSLSVCVFVIMIVLIVNASSLKTQALVRLKMHKLQTDIQRKSEGQAGTTWKLC